jgi:hypothetical protein
MRFHLTPVKTTIIKKTTTNVGKGAGEKEPLYTVGGNVNYYGGNQHGGPSKT